MTSFDLCIFQFRELRRWRHQKVSAHWVAAERYLLDRVTLPSLADDPSEGDFLRFWTSFWSFCWRRFREPMSLSLKPVSGKLLGTKAVSLPENPRKCGNEQEAAYKTLFRLLWKVLQLSFCMHFDPLPEKPKNQRHNFPTRSLKITGGTSPQLSRVMAGLGAVQFLLQFFSKSVRLPDEYVASCRCSEFCFWVAITQLWEQNICTISKQNLINTGVDTITGVEKMEFFYFQKVC